MIKLFREVNSQPADIIEAEFRDIVLGYDCVLITAEDAMQLFGAEVVLPVITNNERVVSGEALPAYIKELRQLMHSWQLFQNNTCCVLDDEEVF